MYCDGDWGSCPHLCVVQRALELSGANENDLIWPRSFPGTLGSGAEK